MMKKASDKKKRSTASSAGSRGRSMAGSPWPMYPSAIIITPAGYQHDGIHDEDQAHEADGQA